MDKCVIIRVNNYPQVRYNLEFFQPIFAISNFNRTTNIGLNDYNTSFHFVIDSQHPDRFRGLIFELVVYAPEFKFPSNTELDDFLRARAEYCRMRHV